MNCPKCNIALMMADRQGVEIDYCPQCRGVWLDRGELDKIIERNSSKFDPQSYQQNDGGMTGPYGRGNNPNDRRRRDDDDDNEGGFLGRLFDFF